MQALAASTCSGFTDAKTQADGQAKTEATFEQSYVRTAARIPFGSYCCDDCRRKVEEAR
jgi:hypothetical protein